MLRRIKSKEYIRLFRINTRKVFDIVLQIFGIRILHRTLQVNNNTPFDILLQHVLGVLRESISENFSDSVCKMVGRG